MPTTIILSSIIIILCIALKITLSKINIYKKRLTQEIQRRILPFITLEIDIDSSTIFLINESHSHARNIQIQDFSFDLGYDFKKYLTLRFDAIPILAPHQKIKANFSVYEGSQTETASKPDNLIAHISGSSFEIHIHYTNLEETPFSCIIQKDKDKISVKSVKDTS